MLFLLTSQSSERLVILSSLTQKLKVHDLVFSIANAQILKEFNQICNCTFLKEEMSAEGKIREDRKNPKEFSSLFSLSESLVGIENIIFLM